MHAAATATAVTTADNVAILRSESMQRQACKDTSSRRHYAEARSSYAQPFLAAHMTASRELRHRARGKFFESVLHNESNTNSYLGMSRMKGMRHQSTCNRNFCPSPLRKFFENGLYSESNTKPYLGMSRMKRVRHQNTCNHNFCPDDDPCGICGTLGTFVPP